MNRCLGVQTVAWCLGVQTRARCGVRWRNRSHGSHQSLLLVWREAGARRWSTRTAWVGAGPHMNGPSPWIEHGGPWRASRAALATSRAALATPTAATAPTSAARRGTPSRGRWRRKWRRRRLAGRCSEKRRGRRHRLLHVEFSKEQVCANVAEGRKQLLASDQLCHELKPFVEAAQDVQDERAVTDGLAKISKGINLGLHLATVVVDGEGALRGCEIQHQG